MPPERKVLPRIVWQSVVLAFLIGELGLKKKLVACDDACTVCGSQSFADRSFKVVTALVGRIDAAKARSDGEFGKGRRAIFFPGGAVKEAGDLDAGHQFILTYGT